MNTDPLREQLQRLPDPQLPDTLWPKLRRAQRRRTVRRKILAGGGVLALGLTAGLLLFAHAPLQPVETRTVQARTPVDSVARLHAVDRALQAAYARGASDAELEPLWDIRHRLAVADTSLRHSAQGDIL